MSATLVPDAVQEVLTCLKAALGDSFEDKKLTYYDGDPGPIPEFNLPAIIVSQLRDTTSKASVAEHDLSDRVVIKVVFNKKDDWANQVEPTNTTETRIRRLIGARTRDESGRVRFAANTVKGALARGLDNNRRVGKTMTTDIGIAGRQNKMITAEGHVTIEVIDSVYTN